MQSAVRRYHLQAGAQPQVKGVAENDVRADFMQFDRRHRLDRTVSAHRHEGRRFDGAVGELQSAAAGGAGGGV